MAVGNCALHCILLTVWKIPPEDDIQSETNPHQIIPCDVVGRWVNEDDNTFFKLDNLQEIQDTFETQFS